MQVSYDMYTDYLAEIFWQRLIVAILLFVALLIVVIWIFVRKEPLGIKAIFVGFEMALIVGAAVSIVPYGMDIAQNAYVVYKGDYTVHEIVMENSRGYSAIFYLDGERVKLRLDACLKEPLSGEYEGTLVYSKNTKLLFDWDNTENGVNESPALVEKQVEQMEAFFEENESIFNELQELSKSSELEFAMVQEDGYFLLPDSSKRWIDNISERVKPLFSTENKEYAYVDIDYFKEDVNSSTQLMVGVYYPENRMMYTIVHCEQNPIPQDDRYQHLKGNWYLWVTGMT